MNTQMNAFSKLIADFVWNTEDRSGEKVLIFLCSFARTHLELH